MSDSIATTKSEDVLFDLLEKHGARPSLSGVDWARQNWYNLQSVSDRISVLQRNARSRAGKGKSFICAVLGSALVAAIEFRDQQLKAENQTIGSLQELVQTLQKQTEELKKQLEYEKHDAALLLEALKEQLRCRDTTDTVVHNLPQEKVYPLEGLKEIKSRLNKLEDSPAQLRPLIKTEYTFDNSEDLDPQMNVKEIPFSATELAKLRKDFSRSPKESETEYVWRVSLTGGDQILLTEKEAEGYWGPGVFLTTGNNRAPWSLTQRAAYWAGGLNPLERGDPLAINGTVDQLVESVQKAACLQMMYDRKLQPHHESPMMMPVDPERMTPLIRGLPESLKPIGIQLQGKIQAMPQGERTRAALEGSITSNHLQSGHKAWTWGEVAQELINYGRKYGPVISSTSKFETKGVRRAVANSTPPPIQTRNNGSKGVSFSMKPSGRNIDHKRNNLWTLGWQKGIPRDLMNGLSTDRLERLVNGWPNQKLEKSNTLIPSAPSLESAQTLGPQEN
ncbi:LOW QUALITY PROTEIN: uncharacterized protein LOC107322042 [Coturnix japonica]|uniref:LOW QUALITY PROTEIN: uncharacterized protein LOC107322042 n=1 Tax=Coturnix japonica TaxID=93934 RepID=UPI0013A5CE81|nr:LOW QUALITY PROTEIN: uncharacterized protein LOC107322042 [Coturnix japonica]